jgi:CRP/FNR family cyclic AMP-dependent transcriptional regulator
MHNLSRAPVPHVQLVDLLDHTLDRCAPHAVNGGGLRATLSSLASFCDYQAGQLIFRENAPADQLLLILVGSVALEISVPGRGKVRLISLGPGDWVGWSALMGGGRMTTSAIAVTDTVVARYSANELRQVCDQDHGIGYPMMKCVAESIANRLVATRLQLLDLFSPQTIAKADCPKSYCPIAACLIKFAPSCPKIPADINPNQCFRLPPWSIGRPTIANRNIMAP